MSYPPGRIDRRLAESLGEYSHHPECERSEQTPPIALPCGCEDWGKGSRTEERIMRVKVTALRSWLTNDGEEPDTKRGWTDITDDLRYNFLDAFDAGVPEFIEWEDPEEENDDGKH